MPKGYWIGHVDVENAENYPDYMKAAQPAYEKYGARFLVRGGRFEQAEGAGRGRHVVVEFDSYEQALACYNSLEYQAAAEIRRANSSGDILIVEGAG
ncbi:MAG TPA: DUF1330 domain-containing protein [Parvularculaceae bacterium]|nr:DUF1330 domain-containing protein [Parvularculaceae bacterium]HNS85676.1 DUF1330 domain-containing protein [Parvularculaceae bacterium]